MSDSNTSTTTSWFSSWFNTPYYHILYQNRDDQEAQHFIDNITHYLNLPEQATILDLACGKGRHAIYLNQLGFTVTGADLSANSIKDANQSANKTLQFIEHDMRLPIGKQFDAVFNLFTSFGYFENDADDLKTLIAIKDSLTEHGFAVIDFLNVQKVIKNLVPEETKTIDGIDFNIKRYIKDHHIYKEISFTDQNQDHHYTEKVKALSLQDFENLMEQAGIYLLDIFGDYKLKKYHPTESDRLILIFK